MKRTLSLLLTLLMLITSLPLNALVALAEELTAVSVESISENTADQVALLKVEDGKGSNGKIVYKRQELIKGYCTANGTPVASNVHSYFTMDAAGIEAITITPPDAPEWNHLNIYYIVIVEEDGTVSCYGRLDQQEPTVIELGGKVKGTVYFNAFYDDHPEYVYVKEAIVVPHEHSHTATVIPPTCTEQGYTTYTCACGDSYVGDYVDSVGHAWGEWKDAALGKEERSCNACGETETRDKTPVYDINGDGAVEKSDAKDLLSMLVGNSAAETLPDLDFDGKLTIYDCVLLMQQVNG